MHLSPTPTAAAHDLATESSEHPSQASYRSHRKGGITCVPNMAAESHDSDLVTPKCRSRPAGRHHQTPQIPKCCSEILCYGRKLRVRQDFGPRDQVTVPVSQNEKEMRWMSNWGRRSLISFTYTDSQQLGYLITRTKKTKKANAYAPIAVFTGQPVKSSIAWNGIATSTLPVVRSPRRRVIMQSNSQMMSADNAMSP
jgi:hypothetical protein